MNLDVFCVRSLTSRNFPEFFPPPLSTTTTNTKRCSDFSVAVESMTSFRYRTDRSKCCCHPAVKITYHFIHQLFPQAVQSRYQSSRHSLIYLFHSSGFLIDHVICIRMKILTAGKMTRQIKKHLLVLISARLSVRNASVS